MRFGATDCSLPDATDCSLPMTWAMQHNVDVDCFILYTDSETCIGRVSPHEALVEYRRKMGKPEAKLIVMAMQVNDFTIADPADPGMMDMVGFDASAPELVSMFASGELSGCSAGAESKPCSQCIREFP